MGRFLRRGGCTLGLAVLAVVFWGRPVAAALPGANGDIVYRGPDLRPNGGNFTNLAIFSKLRGQLTFPDLSDDRANDSHPAFSPDGQQIAFVRSASSGDEIVLMTAAGTIVRTLAAAAAPRTIGSVAWSADGQRLAFTVAEPTAGGLFVINADGTGLLQVLAEFGSERTMFDVEWSPREPTKIAYRCRYRPLPSPLVGQSLRDDFCIVDTRDSAVQRIPVDWSGAAPNTLVGLSRPRWLATGDGLMFTMLYIHLQTISFTTPNGNVTGTATGYQRREIFSIAKDGTGLTEWTRSDYVITNGEPHVVTRVAFQEAHPSPDGVLVLAEAQVSSASAPTRREMWTLDNQARHIGTPMSGFTFPILPAKIDWQPLPYAFSLVVEDGLSSANDAGHHFLQGMKVEMRTLAGDVLDDHPINVAGGSYVFEHLPPPGSYVFRATLVDNAVQPPIAPAFDIRHSGAATEPVWVEWQITVSGPADSWHFFSGTDAAFTTASSDVSQNQDRLDDMANIYYRMRQYTDWVRSRLTPDTGATVKYYTFADKDPMTSAAVGPNDAYYRVGANTIVFGRSMSDYENRDGVSELADPATGVPAHDNDAPQNGEWHEFSHHLFSTFVNPAPCLGTHTNHGGYNNSSTCDSLHEGFAVFLPMVAARDIEGATAATYDGFGFDFDATRMKAWGHRRDSTGELTFAPTHEDLAVAALFWDLFSSEPGMEDSQVIGQDGLHHPVTYQERFALSIQELWSQLTAARPTTVFEVRQMFGAPPITIDLDGDSVNDVAPIDEVFLMHGFFPVTGDQQIIGSHVTYHYDVNFAQRQSASLARNAFVGDSSHRQYDAAGNPTRLLTLRPSVPHEPSANVKLQVLDGAGNPVSGDRYRLTLSSSGTGTGTTSGGGLYGGLKTTLVLEYPGNRTRTHTRMLSGGEGALVHLELPPYFDYLLPDGGLLPPCNPSTDKSVLVSITAEANGLVSDQTPPFDSCTYQRAMATAQTAAALEYLLTVPGDTTPVAVVTAVPGPGSTLDGWTGPDAAECAAGAVRMTADKRCEAVFTAAFTLTLAKLGTGSGTVTGAGSYAPGQTVAVTATPDAGSSFLGWSGANAGECAAGSVVMDRDKSCTAIFEAGGYTLALTTAGTGTGQVTGGGTYGSGQVASVAATAGAGSTFAGWGGPNGPECATGSVLMNGNKSCTAFFNTQTVLPSGTIRINDGATATNDRAVTLALSCTASAGCSQMQFSASPTKGWSRWQPYAATAPWSLARGDGQQSVFARFEDRDGNVSPVAAAQILLDTVAPTGALAIEAGAAYTTASAVTLTATCADAPSGCVLMQFSSDGVAWTALEPFRATRSWTLASGSGTRTVYVRYGDGAGNLSAARSDSIVVDAAPPAGTVAINSGGAGTQTRSVTLTFTCADTGGSGCATIQLSNDGTTWDVPQPYATSAAWDLSAGDGTKTVSARFVDGAGNVSPLATAEIALDTTAPAGTVAINGGEAATSARAVTLTLVCTDTGSGCAQMQFSTTDTRGWSKLQPFSTSAPFTLPSGTGTMSVYVRFIDAAGNAVIVSDTIVKQ